MTFDRWRSNNKLRAKWRYLRWLRGAGAKIHKQLSLSLSLSLFSCSLSLSLSLNKCLYNTKRAVLCNTTTYTLSVWELIMRACLCVCVCVCVCVYVCLCVCVCVWERERDVLFVQEHTTDLCSKCVQEIKSAADYLRKKSFYFFLNVSSLKSKNLDWSLCVEYAVINRPSSGFVTLKRRWSKYFLIIIV